MDNALYAFMDDVDCNMPCVWENASMSVNPHDCDDMLHQSIGVVKISNFKLLKKEFKKFHKNLCKFTSEKNDLIANLNKSKKLVEKYKKLIENSCEKLKEFERLNMDLDTKLICLTNLLMVLNVTMNLLTSMPSTRLLNLLLKRKMVFVAIML